MSNIDSLEIFIEAAILASESPISVRQISALFDEEERPESNDIKEALARLEERYKERGIQLQQVASGYRFQVNEGLALRLKRLWETKPPRYSRAFLETLSIIAYKQPITRGEVESIRGVSVSGSIMRTLLDNDWVKVLGQREVPGRPSLYGTTKAFLDHFNMKSLVELPSLPEIALTHENNDGVIEVLDELKEESSESDAVDDIEVTPILEVNTDEGQNDAHVEPANKPESNE